MIFCMNNASTRAAGVFFARALLGIIFLMQGYGKVFKYTVPKVYDMFFKQPSCRNGLPGAPLIILLILN
jgi:uncharacterized membrane protein YphA (DoxX/SURF4 family)